MSLDVNVGARIHTMLAGELAFCLAAWCAVIRSETLVWYTSETPLICSGWQTIEYREGNSGSVGWGRKKEECEQKNEREREVKFNSLKEEEKW